MSPTCSQLHQLISENLFHLDPSFGDDSDLYAEGLDSMALMQLILLLEQSFDIQLAPGDLARSHFQSLRSLGELITQKQTL